MSHGAGRPLRSDLSVSETELRSARTQLHTAGRDLALARAKLEATEGELGLTRSQNELMKVGLCVECVQCGAERSYDELMVVGQPAARRRKGAFRARVGDWHTFTVCEGLDT